MSDVNYSVKALPKGKFYVRMRSKELQLDTSKGTFATEAEAKAHMKSLMRAQVVVPQERIAPVHPRDQLVEHYALRWIEEKAQSKTLEPTTIEHIRHKLKNQIIPYFGQMPLSSVTRQHAKDFIALLHTKLGGGTVNNVRMWANNMFLAAVEDGLIPGSPLTKVRGIKIKHNERAASCPTPDQIEELLQWLDKNPAWGFPIRTALYTGMRRGELLALIWRDIDFNRGSLTLTRSVANAGYGDYRKSPKTSSSNRTIYLVPQLLAEMRAELEKRLLGMSRQDALNSEIFLSPSGAKCTVNYFGETIADTLKKAGMLNAAGEGYTLHDLRHHHATFLLREKEPVKIVSQRLGHSSVITTMQIYQHVTKEDDQNLSGATSRIGARRIINAETDHEAKLA